MIKYISSSLVTPTERKVMKYIHYSLVTPFTRELEGKEKERRGEVCVMVKKERNKQKAGKENKKEK